MDNFISLFVKVMYHVNAKRLAPYLVVSLCTSFARFGQSPSQNTPQRDDAGSVFNYTNHITRQIQIKTSFIYKPCCINLVYKNSLQIV